MQYKKYLCTEMFVRSGIEENFNEKDELLHQIFLLMQQFQNIKINASNCKESQEQGQLERDLWAAQYNLQEHDYGGMYYNVLYSISLTWLNHSKD